MRILLKMIIVFCVICNTVFARGSVKEANLQLAENGLTDYKIYQSVDASEPEKFAAQEFIRYFQKSCGIHLKVVKDFPKDGKVIAIGISKTVRKLCPDINFDILKPDEILLRRTGNTIILSGERPRGSIYAVYEFLENELGIRFWLPEYTEIPVHKNFSIKTLDLRYAPPIHIREAFGVETNNNPFAVKMRNNGHYNLKLTSNMGGHYVYKPDLCHTFSHILPYKKYVKTHPEYFTLIGKKRFEAQLCFSNKNMRKEFIKNALECVRTNRKKGFRLFQFSQLDGVGEHHNCQCQGCVENRKKLGSSTDVLIDFMNEVTESITNKYPDVTIETLAYSYTKTAPVTVKPHKKLVIRLCLGYNNALYPLHHSENAKYFQDFLNWRKLGVTLSLWIYKVNYSAMLTPYPNFGSYKNELAAMLASGSLFSVFLQGTQGSPNDFSGLKTYLGSKLLWNPDLDSDEIIDEYIDGVYKNAAPDVKEYMTLLTTTIRRNSRKLTPGPTTASYLKMETLLKGLELIRRGIAKIPNQEKTAMRQLRLIELGLLQAIAARPELHCMDDSPEITKWRGKIDVKNLYNDIAVKMKALGCSFYGEHISRNQGLATLRANLFLPTRSGKKVQIGRDLTNINYLEYSVPDIHCWYKAKEVNDPAAATGRAAYFNYDTYFWPVFLQFPPVKKETRYSVYLSARCIPEKNANTKSPAFSTGVYDYTCKRYLIPEFSIAVNQCSPEKYTFFKVGTVRCIPGNKIQVFVASQIEGGTKQIWIDRVILVPESIKKTEH